MNIANSVLPAGPLDGVRVLDLTTVFMGPSCTQLLGDLGADVIKIEAPHGDSTRAIGPCGELGLGPLFLGLNRNKRSVVLDLKTPEGVEALLRLAREADVFTTNVRPAAMRRLGLGYERLAAENPRLIYASMVGFSQRGPYAAKAAFDDMIQAATGLAAAVGQGSGGVPRYLPITIADRSVGLYAFGVICAALHARHRTGVGQSIDIPMFETMIPYVLGDYLYGHLRAEPGDFGYPCLMTPNRRPYKTQDGYVCCLIYVDRHGRPTRASSSTPIPRWSARSWRPPCPANGRARPTHRTPVPVLDQHTAKVLREAGYTDADIQTLIDRGAARGPALPASAPKETRA